MSEAKELTKDCLNQCPVVPNLFLTVAPFDFENFSWPHSQSIASRTWPKFSGQISFELDWNGFSGRKQMISKKKGLHQNSSGFSGQKQVVSRKRKGLHQNSKNFKHDFFKIRLLPKCSVAHRMAMAHRLKSTGLNYRALVYHYQTDTEQEKVWWWWWLVNEPTNIACCSFDSAWFRYQWRSILAFMLVWFFDNSLVSARIELSRNVCIIF